jgi:DNA mismatch repair protein MSH3
MSADISYFLNSIQLPANADSDANTGQPEPAQMSAGWQSKFAAWKRGAQTVSTASASTSVFANKCTDGVGGEYVDLFVRPQEYPQLSRLHADIGDCEKTLSDMLAVCRRQMADPALSYMTVSGRTHLLEITPRNYTRVPESWGAAVSVTKKSQRFQPPDIAATVVKQQEFKDRLAIAAKDAWIQFLGAFAERQTRFRACGALHFLCVLL